MQITIDGLETELRALFNLLLRVKQSLACIEPSVAAVHAKIEVSAIARSFTISVTRAWRETNTTGGLKMIENSIPLFLGGAFVCGNVFSCRGSKSGGRREGQCEKKNSEAESHVEKGGFVVGRLEKQEVWLGWVGLGWVEEECFKNLNPQGGLYARLNTRSGDQANA